MPAKTAARPETRGRRTLYKGIEMRSRLEADYAAYLDRAYSPDMPWEYEPICFAADGVQWLPDFRLNFPCRPPYDPAHWYHEVKPATLLRQEGNWFEWVRGIDKFLRQMSVAWESEPDAHLMLAFHTYGREHPDFTIYGETGLPWSCTDYLSPNAMPLIWPGMGQQSALPAAPEIPRTAPSFNYPQWLPAPAKEPS